MAWRSCCFLFRLREGGSRWPHSFHQRGFKKITRKPELKKTPEEISPTHTEPAIQSRQNPFPRLDLQAPPTSPRAFGRLVRPFLFTVGFTGSSFAAASIWQYETLQSRVRSFFDEAKADWMEKLRPQKRGDARKEVNQWWNSLSEGQKTVTGIVVINFLVFCCWRIPSLQRVMIRYFTANPASKVLCAPMILSTFSHFSFFHLATNMYVLWSFSSSAVSILGREQFMAVYLSAGVISSFFSYVCKTLTGRFGPSLGASGAIMTVLAAVCTKMPEAKLAIVFLPMFTFTATHALKAIVAIDTAGLVLGWKIFDHAAHLGGAAFGVWYMLTGHELIWRKRESLVKLWHELRTRGRGG
ncbi:presenilins-associated rhomboid-like protein, mitochondrial isoform X1 [Gouania willdenowi]|uniref:presenilins-associated rhomboid-like protein, mitochondrial isoform X1 n=1 Tax=Gouania willdenowi TaxID=441366 RepID=UPI001054E614|nr:presenilins-associated rhomboid-like protein, mitochondrial isoform X1 [Gouania willdenowi]